MDVRGPFVHISRFQHRGMKYCVSGSVCTDYRACRSLLYRRYYVPYINLAYSKYCTLL
jgi:hypothetical protein